jgi:hypothetical protein
MRSFIIGVLILVSTTPAFAKFACGPNASTYAVMQPNPKKLVLGVRCVVFPNDYTFAWYGEGQWGTATYRHLGFARATDTNDHFVGSAGDIYGNGENSGGLFKRSLNITISHAFPQNPWSAANPPSAIEIRGAWNEDWLRVPDGSINNWNPLGKVTHCGALEEWKIDDPKKVGTGVRCVLKDESWLTAWYGEGTWGSNWAQNSYRHIGTADMGPTGNKWGAVDLCLPGLFCGKAPWGTLNVTKPSGGTIRVKGTWDEWWRL